MRPSHATPRAAAAARNRGLGSHGEAGGLADEIARLREQLARERSETIGSVEEYSRRIAALQQDNESLQAGILHAQERKSAKGTEALAVEREMLEKTAAIEKVMRELEQRQQATLDRISCVANEMLKSCAVLPADAVGGPVLRRSQVDAPGGMLAGSIYGHSDPSVADVHGREERESIVSVTSKKVSASHIDLAAGVAPAGVVAGQVLDKDEQEWFRKVKENLEHFGGVEVFIDASTRDCACCLEPMNTLCRIRPQKCRHVFHIECLLQWWTEGTCPVCSVSFAPGPDRASGLQSSLQGHDGRNSDVEGEGGIQPRKPRREPSGTGSIAGSCAG
mmetsp:Transcript_33235/g.105219  ORF Transcript_33235/g.105219 Transcript_33235/m.105219 type:complete len:334 (-) Transcript_33235:29-1030(-)